MLVFCRFIAKTEEILREWLTVPVSELVVRSIYNTATLGTANGDLYYLA